MKNFAIIGAGGYIAPRHMQAIKETGNNLVAAMDVHDSVGVLDSYFPDAAFFTSIEALKCFINDRKEDGNPVDFLTVCSPNYLHEEHILIGLQAGLNVICEKPVALSAESILRLKAAEENSGKKISTIMQLRLHPAIKKLKESLDSNKVSEPYKVDVKYITARGRWYHNSWKGDVEKSGGIATNIGIHLFDLLLWLFGDVEENIVTEYTDEKIAGQLLLKDATVNWLLCIDENELPSTVKESGKRVYRSFTINDNIIDFSEGTLSLHTASYGEVLAGRGFSLAITEPSVQLVSAITEKTVVALNN